MLAAVRTGARPRLIEGLLLRPNAHGDDGGVERGEFGAFLDLLIALAAGVDLGVKLAGFSG